MTKEETVAGQARTAYWHGVDFNATERAGRVTLQMGTSRAAVSATPVRYGRHSLNCDYCGALPTPLTPAP